MKGNSSNYIRHYRAMEYKWRNMARSRLFTEETASTAYFRLKEIVSQDRAACGYGRWELSGINLSGFYLESCLMKKKHVSFDNKPRCRWVQRS